jgi:predicted PurR-regulated permease PerM
MIFLMLIGFLTLICLSLTIIVSKQKEQINTIIQELSILKKEGNTNLQQEGDHVQVIKPELAKDEKSDCEQGTPIP